MIKKLIERRAMTAAIVRAVRSRTLECLINACQGSLQIEALLVLDCFLFPSRNACCCDANLRAAF